MDIDFALGPPPPVPAGALRPPRPPKSSKHDLTWGKGFSSLNSKRKLPTFESEQWIPTFHRFKKPSRLGGVFCPKPKTRI